jgi:hypothetical protein
MQVSPRYTRISDAPKMFSLTEQTLRRRSSEGCFNLNKRGRLTLFSIAEVERWIQTGEPKKQLGRACYVISRPTSTLFGLLHDLETTWVLGIKMGIKMVIKLRPRILNI